MPARRRVVTGQTAEGKSVIVSDSQVEPVEVVLLPGYEFHPLWGSDTPPVLPTDGSRPTAPGYFPPAEGYRFAFFTVSPDSIAFPEDFDILGALEDLEQKLPGFSAPMEPENPGMHTTDTVDVDFVVSGEVWLELDDGAEVQLLPGDTVIQNGTRHAWHNRGTEPAVVFVALLGAHRT
jgi:mannose-6-phosphate isomerase-like protein (cupin superfamily)